MVCIYCGHKTNVNNSRPQKRVQAVWRRRHCPNCGAIFTTQEQADLSSSVVFETSKGKLLPFDRQTLFLSLYEALRHRASAQADATHLCNTIIGKLLPQVSEGRLLRHNVVSTSSAVLKHFDRAAAVSYLAFHPL